MLGFSILFFLIERSQQNYFYQFPPHSCMIKGSSLKHGVTETFSNLKLILLNWGRWVGSVLKNIKTWEGESVQYPLFYTFFLSNTYSIFIFRFHNHEEFVSILGLVVAVLLLDHNNGQGPTDNNTNKRVQCDDDALMRAIANKKENQGLSYRSIAEAYGVPHMTLYNYTKQSKPIYATYEQNNS